MLPLKPRGRSPMVGRLCSREASDRHFHCAPWLATTVLASVSDSLVRVSRRGKEDHFLRPDAPGPKLTAGRVGAERAPATGRAPKVGTRKMAQAPTDHLRFPLSNFRHSLTLFSKFFSSFLHSTCSLSVSHPYLAFDGIYHRL